MTRFAVLDEREHHALAAPVNGVHCTAGIPVEAANPLAYNVGTTQPDVGNLRPDQTGAELARGHFGFRQFRHATSALTIDEAQSATITPWTQAKTQWPWSACEKTAVRRSADLGGVEARIFSRRASIGAYAPSR